MIAVKQRLQVEVFHNSAEAVTILVDRHGLDESMVRIEYEALEAVANALLTMLKEHETGEYAVEKDPEEGESL